MIKFTGSHDGNTYVGLGLSAENIEKLQNGQPILIMMEELKLDQTPFQEILIFAGNTESDMLDDLERAGAIGQTTMMHVDPRVEDDG